MSLPSGLGKLDRERLAAILRAVQSTISVKEAAKILAMPNEVAAKLLARWAKKGWLNRVKQGLYIPVPLESTTGEITFEDPWIIAEKLYSPCYIGGWSAVEHWGLTEQIFRTVVILTTQKPRNHHPSIKGTSFLLCTIYQKAMFGLKPIWRGQTRVQISDPTRTILDLLLYPKLGGGIRSVTDILLNYLQSEYKDLQLLISYAQQLNKKVVFKRLGFLLEQYAPQETEIIELCYKWVTISKVKLDPQLEADKLITRWRLWIPTNWEK